MRLDATPVSGLDSPQSNAPEGAFVASPAQTLAQVAQELLDGPVESISNSPVPARSNPTMGNLKKISYTHDALIDMIVLNPALSQGQLAAQFGYSQSWVSNIMASDAFQARLAERRKEVIDPTIIATFEERIKGMTLQAINKVQAAMEAPACKPEVALRALELGAKAMGLGGNAAPKVVPLDLTVLADRLLALRGAPIPINGTSERID